MTNCPSWMLSNSWRCRAGRIECSNNVAAILDTANEAADTDAVFSFVTRLWVFSALPVDDSGHCWSRAGNAFAGNSRRLECPGKDTKPK